MNRNINAKTTILMKTFIEDYLQNPSKAIEKAQQTVSDSWYDTVDEDMIYEQIASGEFRLYEAMIFAPSEKDFPARVHMSA